MPSPETVASLIQSASIILIAVTQIRLTRWLARMSRYQADMAVRLDTALWSSATPAGGRGRQPDGGPSRPGNASDDR